MMNRIYIFGSVALGVLVITGGLFAWNHYAATKAVPAIWKTYTDPKQAFSISYPNMFILATNDTAVTRAVLLGDQNKNRYFYIERRDQISATDAALFTGSYPRVEHGLTIAKKNLNGFEGIEVYGYVEQVHTYVDTFAYKIGSAEVSLGLNPKFEGREVAATTTAVTTIDEATYRKILASLTFAK